jgi:hypothetical protein
MHAFLFCAHRRGAGGAPDSLVESACWVEPGCRGGRPGLPLTIGSPGLPLYMPYIYRQLLVTNSIVREFQWASMPASMPIVAS